jgi:hypothetical protein
MKGFDFWGTAPSSLVDRYRPTFQRSSLFPEAREPQWVRCAYIFLTCFISGDSTGAVDVTKHVLAQMQEKGRRLAQELPGFNWLEEKIRNGGMMTPRRQSGATCRSNGGSTVETSSTDMRTAPTSEAATIIPGHHVSKSTLDTARSNDLHQSLSPTEYRLVHTYISRESDGRIILKRTK